MDNTEHHFQGRPAGLVDQVDQVANLVREGLVVPKEFRAINVAPDVVIVDYKKFTGGPAGPRGPFPTAGFPGGPFGPGPPAVPGGPFGPFSPFPLGALWPG